MTPTEIRALLSQHGHDAHTDWVFDAETQLYYSASGAACTIKMLIPLSPASAAIIAQHYKGLEANASRV